MYCRIETVYTCSYGFFLTQSTLVSSAVTTTFAHGESFSFMCCP